MAGPNIGYATLSVVPSLRGMQGQLQQQLGGMTAGIASQFDQAGAQASRSFGGRLMDGVRRLGSDVGELLTSSLGAAGIAGGALFGRALASGWERFTMIEDATASLAITLGDAA